MRNGCELIQISNTHGISSSIGSPVFYSFGMVLGLNCFSVHNLDFAIHFKCIKDFWNSSQNLGENFIQRRGQKEIETTKPMDIDSSSKGDSKSSRKGKAVSEGSSTYKGSSISKGSGMKSMIPFGEAFGLQKVADSYQNTRGMQNEDDSNNTTLRQFFCPYGQLVHVEILVGKRCGLVQFADTWEDKKSDFHGVIVLHANSWIKTSGAVDFVDINLNMKLLDVLELLKIPICTMEAILNMEITSKPPNSISSRLSPSAGRSEYCICRKDLDSWRARTFHACLAFLPCQRVWDCCMLCLEVILNSTRMSAGMIKIKQRAGYGCLIWDAEGKWRLSFYGRLTCGRAAFAFSLIYSLFDRSS